MALFSGDLFSVFDEESSTGSEKKRPAKRASSNGSSSPRESSATRTKRQKLDLDSLEADDDDSTEKQEDERTELEGTKRVPFFGEPAIIVNIDTEDTCTHEVSVPANYKFESLKPLNEKPAKEYPFKLDSFQRKAIQCIENNQSVLVSAHTSAGKTVVAEYAIAVSLRDRQRVIYTTPLKALSNQKYREMYEEFKDVGLMTGDTTINPTASCIVMTTEILRSMLYRGSEVMREVGWVVFDEIHYMRDKVLLVHMSVLVIISILCVTVFKMMTLSSPCHVVYTEQRPVPLQHYLYPAGADGLYLVVDENGKFREDNFQTAMSCLQESGIGNKKGTKGPSNCYKVVKMIMERSLQPVIIFSFSRRECEALALQMSKLDFNTAREKELVDEVFTNAIDCLSDDDKQLPQVVHLLPLLKRGIGIHHSGLLPILKETIEILFSEGLIKALFATETFALGLNMPARTVVFTNARKFDGKDFRWITSGEYIQMSGRAGRRGLDERGIVMLMIDEQMDSTIGKTLLKGQPDPLNSAFHLTYNMVLNLLRVEEINPEYMLERSFYQFQNNSTIPDLEEKVKVLEKKRDALVIEDEDNVTSYYKMRDHISKLSMQMQRFITKPTYCIPFMQPGRLVNVIVDGADFGWGAVINFQKKTSQTTSIPETIYIVEVLLRCSTDSAVPKPATGHNNREEMRIIPSSLNSLHKLSSVRVYLPKDLRPSDSRFMVGKSIDEVIKRFPDGLPLLDPVADMNIKDEEFKKIVKKIEALEKRLVTSVAHKNPNLEQLNSLCQRKIELSSAVRESKRELKKAQTIMQMDELKCRKRVLRRLGYANSSDVIELKGRVACEIDCGEELLLTEMIFNGAFNDLSVEQCVALLSCFVFQEKTDEMPKLTEELSGPLRLMQDSARKIAKVAKEAKLDIDEDTYVESFRPHLMDVLHAWSTGAAFSQICKMTDVFEGSIIRCIRRLEEILRQMCQAAKTIGNTELENKFAQGIMRIKRDIVFAASLYL
ncbi:PREDICTED: superkiller viralicidic activity 2-like 2 [Amphimedon queenslandica]|uniref:Exosome RNA helicase MTR4 n=2 Tax=Amphimedon queenslandica TaxID=400682 RepID=A0AAN0J7V9_AMPQE|nr:PREDICTED: superkiller viralicidic activity 2-like 2 [Amphimedon queenslandica]|eukprot:XP_019852783.1 PREDICTED: superkiller viralicidic activity 2-like 2 [Amphimedon queenslandica]